MADDRFLQTCKPSVSQNNVFETKTLPTFPLFLSEHAYVVWISSGSSNLHSIFRLRALRYSIQSQKIERPKPMVTHSQPFSRASHRLRLFLSIFDWLSRNFVLCDWPEWLLADIGFGFRSIDPMHNVTCSKFTTNLVYANYSQAFVTFMKFFT